MLNRLKKILFSAKDNSLPYQPQKTDVYLASYPKSGNTWVRFVLASYLIPKEIVFSNVAEFIPDLHSNPEHVNSLKSNPRIIKTHFSFQKYYNRVVYICRDGRDVAVSYYFYLIKKGELDKDLTFEKYFYEFFLTGKIGFGDWSEHVKSFMHKDHICFVKYEDLLVDTDKMVKEILTYIGLDIDQSKLDKAIEENKFDQMQKKEQKDSNFIYEEKGLKKTDYGVVRKGVSGGWKDVFTEKMNDDFWYKYGTLMTELGYQK